MFNEYFYSPIGAIEVTADGEHLLSVKILDAMVREEHKNWVSSESKRQLEEYFAGKRRRFELPLRLEGTDFQKTIWSHLLSIDYGTTCSYSDIAWSIGRPGAQRAVGAANRLNCLPIIIPCHRVIGKKNQLVGYALGIEKKAWLLRHEREAGLNL